MRTMPPTAVLAVPRVSPVAELELRVVKVPAAAVPEPMAPGAAKVAPLSELAFRLATLVVEAITSGAVPVATVEVS